MRIITKLIGSLFRILIWLTILCVVEPDIKKTILGALPQVMERVGFERTVIVSKINSEGSWSPQPTRSEWVAALEKYEIAFPEVVVAQMLLETGRLTSRVYQENNNPFGMKRNSRGFCLNPPGSLDPEVCSSCFDCQLHACYESVHEALQDYAGWQKQMLKSYENYYFYKVETQEQYLLFLNDLVIKGKPGYRYATDPDYTEKIQNILASFEANPEYLNPSTSQ